MRSGRAVLYRQMHRVRPAHAPKDQVSMGELSSLTTCDPWNIAILLSYRYAPGSVPLLLRLRITWQPFCPYDITTRMHVCGFFFTRVTSALLQSFEMHDPMILAQKNYDSVENRRDGRRMVDRKQRVWCRESLNDSRTSMEQNTIDQSDWLDKAMGWSPAIYRKCWTKFAWASPRSIRQSFPSNVLEFPPLPRYKPEFRIVENARNSMTTIPDLIKYARAFALCDRLAWHLFATDSIRNFKKPERCHTVTLLRDSRNSMSLIN